LNVTGTFQQLLAGRDLAVTRPKRFIMFLLMAVVALAL
jgi:hypothetical protein